MSVKTAALLYWPPALVGAGSTAVLTVAINYGTGGKPGWWWAIVVASALGLAGSLVWGEFIRRAANDQTPASSRAERVVQQSAGGAQQSATGHGTTVSIHSNDHSAAAWNIDTVNFGQDPRSPDSGT